MIKQLQALLIAVGLSLGPCGSIAHGQDVPAPVEPVVMTEVLRVDPQPHPIFVPPPPLIEPGSVTASAIHSLVININYNPTGTGRCEVAVVPWPNEARTALEYALRIWSSLLGGDQPIAIDVCWTQVLGAGLLAQGGSSARPADFTGATQSGTLYPISLANQLSHSDINGAGVELQIRFNANQTWYFGTDGHVPVGQFDFVTVALHEFGHPLGFEGTVSWDNGTAPNECDGTNGAGCFGGTPDIYDRFVQNTGGQNLLTSFNNNSVQLGNQLISNTLAFGGANAVAANGNAAPRLFAPATFAPGTSYQHLDEATFNGTPNALMTPALGRQEAIHHPGVVMLGILRDMGWEITDLSTTFVNYHNTSYENGTGLYPFNTAEEGVNAVPNGGTVYFTPGNYPGGLTIIRPMILKSPDGVTVLGAKP